jgi:hypothetical protein
VLSLPRSSALTRRRFLSVAMATTAVVLASPLVPGPRRPLLVAVGSELEPALRQLEPDFERQHPSIDLRWEVLGAQEMVNRQLDGGGERARVLIPSNGAQLRAYAAARRSRGPGEPFAVEPVPIARTVLVAVAWPDRARRMFPDGRFSWQRLRTVAEADQWSALGAPAEWGSVDLRCTDPLRSSSGQMTLALWSRNQPRQMAVQALRRAVYRPARSTDILLQEFISGGRNDGDIALVYESGAIHRLAEAQQRHPGGYELLVPDPTIELRLDAAVVADDAVGHLKDARPLVDHLRGASAQTVLRNQGFRGADGRGGTTAGDRVQRLEPPTPADLSELLKLWQQAG